MLAGAEIEDTVPVADAVLLGEAFPLLTSPNGAPLISASRFGGGRLVAFGSEETFTSETPHTHIHTHVHGRALMIS